jgi:1-acyl-sn-glycerol-3-phosphate acyltransferase
VVDTVSSRLRDGHTVVAFPEGTTYCGRDSGEFRPALFQAAIDADRPVQPLRLTYHHQDGSPSTVTAFLGEDSLWASIKRIVRTRRTVVHVQVRPLQLPHALRSQLAARCQEAVHLQTEDPNRPMVRALS